jgi:hypothetical protein
MERKQAHRGRPTTPPKQGQKTTVSLRLTAEMKAHLDAAAKSTGRPLSQEAELRLEQTLKAESLINQVLTLKYGRQLAGVVRMVGDAMVEAGPHQAFENSKTLEAANNWMSDPAAVAAAKEAAMHIIDVISPTNADAEDGKTRSIGRGFAKSIIQHVMGRGGNEYTKQDEAEIKALLGPLAKNLKVN